MFQVVEHSFILTLLQHVNTEVARAPNKIVNSFMAMTITLLHVRSQFGPL